MHDILIVGGGTAGLTAAVYARRAGKTVLVLEAALWGGQIVSTPEIGNYPGLPGISGAEFGERLARQAREQGAELRSGRVLSLEKAEGGFTAVTKLGRHAARVLILAAGSEPRKLGLPGEEALTGRGVSYCAACDGAFYRGKTVAVAGGGNSALEDALVLTDLAETVYLIHRREEFRGEEATLVRLREKENLRFVLGSRVTGLMGERKLESLRITRRDGQESVLPVSALFVAIGRSPASRAFAGLVGLDADGGIPAGEDCRTEVPGIFAAGDIRTKKVRQLVTAAADGAAAAAEAVRFLGKSGKERSDWSSP